jgi:hypothetical protein
MPASPKRANRSTKFVPLFEFSFTARAANTAATMNSGVAYAAVT